MTIEYPLGPGERAKQFYELQEKAGMLWRDKKYEALEDLLKEVIKTIETWPQKRGVVEAWPYEKLAIIMRRLRDYNDETMVIERFIEMICSVRVSVI